MTEPTAAELRDAVKAYLDWRDKRRAQWEVVANCGHPAGSDCPEFRIVQAEPFDIDQKLDDALRAALGSTVATQERDDVDLAALLHGNDFSWDDANAVNAVLTHHDLIVKHATAFPYEHRVQQMADALHEDCKLEWQAIAVVDPDRRIDRHESRFHYGHAHDLVRRIFGDVGA